MYILFVSLCQHGGFVALEIIQGTIATVVGGLSLTVILFFINEYIVPKKNLTGEWSAIFTTKETSYNTFKDLQTNWTFHLLQKGYEISGYAEKTSERQSGKGLLNFERSKRVHAKINGYLERKYFTKDQLNISFFEEGRERDTTAIIKLTIISSKKLTGLFSSTAADSKGTVTVDACI